MRCKAQALCHVCVQELPQHTHWASHPADLWRAFLSQLPPQLTAQQAHALFLDVFTSAAPVAPPPPAQRYELRLSHTCAARSCAWAECALCRNNPVRPCSHAGAWLHQKYVEKGPILARCEARLHVSVHRCSDGSALTEEEARAELPPFQIQVRCVTTYFGIVSNVRCVARVLTPMGTRTTLLFSHVRYRKLGDVIRIHV